MNAIRAAGLSTLWALVLAGLTGCMGSGDGDSPPEPDLSNLAPVGGVVTLNGKPLAQAVVTFLPLHWSSGVAETDEQGRYSLSYAGHPGVPPDDYKVAISLLISAEGEPQGLGPRSSMAMPPGMMTAKEYLPPEYADLGRTKLTAHVEQAGGTFNFDIKAPVTIIPPRPSHPPGEDGPRDTVGPASRDVPPAGPDIDGTKPASDGTAAPAKSSTPGAEAPTPG